MVGVRLGSNMGPQNHEVPTVRCNTMYGTDILRYVLIFAELKSYGENILKLRGATMIWGNRGNICCNSLRKGFITITRGITVVTPNLD